ncbi:hypothetical protein J6590_009738 [Homalodisca vitripennis]|nr:hypothetical protein J6590_009738 [Homalodisca vitripennis]
MRRILGTNGVRCRSLRSQLSPLHPSYDHFNIDTKCPVFMSRLDVAAALLP